MLLFIVRNCVLYTYWFLCVFCMKVLGIESSCDETAAAVVQDQNPHVLSNIVNSQVNIHKIYGGVVPEYAAREHMRCIEEVVEKAICDTSFDVIAATTGPGLIGGLIVGAIVAKTIAIACNKPFFAINHLEAHILTPRFCFNNIEFPYVAILASGGNFLFVDVQGVGMYNILGQTLDDAAGEAFDKVAKMLGEPYPGGKSIERLAQNGDDKRFEFVIPMSKKACCDVSFSGLKTAVRTQVLSLGDGITMQDKCDIAASFQRTVIEMIMQQLVKAMRMVQQPVNQIVVVGGVASNSLLRAKLEELARESGAKFYAPPIKYCTDNAAMIAWCAIEHVKNCFIPSKISEPVRPNWPLGDLYK